MKMAVACFHPRPNQWAGNLSTMLDAIRLLAESHPAPDLIVLPGACDTGPGRIEPSTVTTAMCQTFRESIATLAREWGVWIACGHTCSHVDGLTHAASLLDPDGDAYIRPAQPARAAAGGQAVALPSFVADTPIGLLAVAVPDALVDPELLQSSEPDHVDLVIACCATAEQATRCESAIASLSRKWQANLCLAAPSTAGAKQVVRVIDFHGNAIPPASVNSGAVWYGRIPLRFGGGRIGSRLIEEPPAEEVSGIE